MHTSWNVKRKWISSLRLKTNLYFACADKLIGRLKNRQSTQKPKVEPFIKVRPSV